ncbi:MAG: hypothetical protein ACRDV6_10405, partial [Acidimicrobiales bacterium]
MANLGRSERSVRWASTMSGFVPRSEDETPHGADGFRVAHANSSALLGGPATASPLRPEAHGRQWREQIEDQTLVPGAAHARDGGRRGRD